MKISWKKFDLKSLEKTAGQVYCLYVFHHRKDKDRPFYIGKAKFFGTKQASGYKASARYNSGYIHLVTGMLRSGFTLYIASIGKKAFKNAECYEQELIAKWNPIQKQRIKNIRKSVKTRKPW
jgi:hypothetical protein